MYEFCQMQNLIIEQYILQIARLWFQAVSGTFFYERSFFYGLIIPLQISILFYL